MMESTSHDVSNVGSMPAIPDDLSALMQESLDQGLGIWDFGVIEPYDPKKDGCWNQDLDNTWRRFPYQYLQENGEYPLFQQREYFMNGHTVKLEVSSRRASGTDQLMPVVMMLAKKDSYKRQVQQSMVHKMYKGTFWKMRGFLTGMVGRT